MGNPRVGTSQPAAPRWRSTFALFLFILFILMLVWPVVTLLVTLLTRH
jgi:hypothetical protein